MPPRQPLVDCFGTLGVFGHLFVGFVKPLSLVVGFGLFVCGFLFYC
jgi:hypothetical protein